MQWIYDQLIVFAFLQSVFLLVLFALSSRYRSKMNGYMLVLIFALFLGLGGKVLYMQGAFGGTRRLILLSEIGTMLFGATTYLYTRSYLQTRKFAWKDLWHYLPALLYSFAIIGYFIIPERETLIERSRSGELQRFIYLLHAVALSTNLAYWWKSIKVYRDWQATIQEEASYAVHSRFFFNLLTILGCCLAFWTVVYLYYMLIDSDLENTIRLSIWLVISLIMLFISSYQIIHPEVFSSLPKVAPKKYAQSRLSTNDLDQLKVDLEKIMLQKKPYLNNKLLKSELAQILGVSNPEMARLLNEKIGMNFFEYVNYYRIKEFIEIAKSDKAQSMTFFGIAQDAGFNSKTTFNKSFKKLMGMTPSQYFKEA